MKTILLILATLFVVNVNAQTPRPLNFDVWNSANKTKTWNPPVASGTLSATNLAETFTGVKTLISPVVSGGTIDSSTITNGSISGAAITATNAALTAPTIDGGTVSGVTITNSIIDASLNTITNLDLTTSVSGVLPISKGGTNNGSLSVSAGAVVFTDGSKLQTTSAGTAGQVLTSQGASAPTFVNLYSVSAISASDIDWSLAPTFSKTLSANTTFTFSNLVSGKVIVVRLTNTASNYTVAWPTVRWSTGTAPTMTTGVKSDVYTFFYDGSNVYGSVVPNMY